MLPAAPHPTVPFTATAVTQEPRGPGGQRGPIPKGEAGAGRSAGPAPEGGAWPHRKYGPRRRPRCPRGLPAPALQRGLLRARPRAAFSPQPPSEAYAEGAGWGALRCLRERGGRGAAPGGTAAWGGEGGDERGTGGTQGGGGEGTPPPRSAASSAYLQVTCLVQPPPGPRARGGTAAGPKMVPVAPAATLGPRTAAAAASAVVPRATASAITVYPTHGDSTGTSGSTSFRAGGGGAGRGEEKDRLPARRRL